jgi:uncharacterized secreted protein with C-terminal beta-propeller domain
MDNNEKEILDKLTQGTSEVEVPENLKPENIEKMLTSRFSNKKKPIRNVFYFAGAAAACLVLVTSILIFRGQIIINKTVCEPLPIENSSEEAKPADENQVAKATVAELDAAESYAQVHGYIQRYWNDTQDIFIKNKAEVSVAEESAAAEDAVSATGSSKFYETPMDSEHEQSEPTGSDADYSDTNAREAGVGEADYVKTDGNYLYLRKGNLRTIAIIDVRSQQMKAIGEIKLPKENSITEFYIKDGKLIIFCNVYLNESDSAVTSGSDVDSEMSLAYPVSSDTQILTYNVTNPSEAKQIAATSQSGNYYSSRLVGDFLYTFSRFDPNPESRVEEYSNYIPSVNGDGISENKIVLPEVRTGNQYFVITSINVNEPDKIVDNKAILSNYGECYVSQENIYIYETDYRTNSERTSIRKLNYKDGTLKSIAKETVNGYLESSFSIDEYNKYLRMVVTVRTPTLDILNIDIDSVDTNSVYVLDENLKLTGKIEGLAEDERIYSARFMGDIGYFVTFRETDPLFSVDLSDPAHPEIIGELKIPGFSEYLHPFQDGLLLGIGMNVEDPDATTESTSDNKNDIWLDDTETMDVDNEVKLSMFDISDPTNVKEIHKSVIHGSYDTEAFYDYKAVLCDAAKDVIGFYVYGELDDYYCWFGYDKQKGFVSKLTETTTEGYYDQNRSLYIKDILYIVNGRWVESYDMNTFKKVDDIKY